jgi:hypothetical protein
MSVLNADYPDGGNFVPLEATIAFQWYGVVGGLKE